MPHLFWCRFAADMFTLCSNSKEPTATKGSIGRASENSGAKSVAASFWASNMIPSHDPACCEVKIAKTWGFNYRRGAEINGTARRPRHTISQQTKINPNPVNNNDSISWGLICLHQAVVTLQPAASLDLTCMWFRVSGSYHLGAPEQKRRQADPSIQRLTLWCFASRQKNETVELAHSVLLSFFVWDDINDLNLFALLPAPDSTNKKSICRPLFNGYRLFKPTREQAKSPQIHWPKQDSHCWRLEF